MSYDWGLNKMDGNLPSALPNTETPPVMPFKIRQLDGGVWWPVIGQTKWFL